VSPDGWRATFSAPASDDDARALIAWITTAKSPWSDSRVNTACRTATARIDGVPAGALIAVAVGERADAADEPDQSQSWRLTAIALMDTPGIDYARLLIATATWADARARVRFADTLLRNVPPGVLAALEASDTDGHDWVSRVIASWMDRQACRARGVPVGPWAVPR
jgi:hypothetical protein